MAASVLALGRTRPAPKATANLSRKGGGSGVCDFCDSTESGRWCRFGMVRQVQRVNPGAPQPRTGDGAMYMACSGCYGTMNRGGYCVWCHQRYIGPIAQKARGVEVPAHLAHWVRCENCKFSCHLACQLEHGAPALLGPEAKFLWCVHAAPEAADALAD